jgi:epoxyqueuosine reductase
VIDEQEILERALELGLTSVGIVRDPLTEHGPRLREWLGEGMHGEMAYLARPEGVARREDLRGTLPSFRSAVVVTHGYFASDPPGVPDDPGRAVIARYARGEDYHGVLHARLEELLEWIREQVGGAVEGRVYVDTGPILERDLARRAGLGWFGKNTMLIHPSRGSFFFVGSLLLDINLEASRPFGEDHCGSCRACLDACPTGALLGYDESGAPVMDARRCISYLTIELKGAIPHELRPLMGNRVFGCDICQECCPWNERFAEVSEVAEYSPHADFDGPKLIELAERLLGMSGKGFNREFAGSPVVRARRKGLLRNVCVALGNWGVEAAVPTLFSALSDAAPLVRGHAAWALGRVGSPAALNVLSSRSADEADPVVLDEIILALGARGE